MLTIFKNLDAVDENILHADRQLMGVIKCRAISDCVWIEDNHVSEHSWFEKASMIQSEIGRRQPR